SAFTVAGVATTAFGASHGVADKGVVFFNTTHNAGGKSFAAGNVTDKLFGAEAVTYVIKTRTLTPGTFKVTVKPVTMWGKTGTLTGTATATLTVIDTTHATITNGKFSEANGTGGWTGHSLTAKFSGSGNPTTGQFKLTYKGTYK